MSQAAQQHITAQFAPHRPIPVILIGRDPILTAIEAHRLSYEVYNAAADHEMDLVRAHG